MTDLRFPNSVKSYFLQGPLSSMSNTKCSKCNYPYSTASRCPNCGYSANQAALRALKWWAIFLAISAVIGGINQCSKFVLGIDFLDDVPAQTAPANQAGGMVYNNPTGHTQNVDPINNPLVTGKWMITEHVAESQGGWVILWNYELSIIDNSVTLRGAKIRVNDKAPTSGELRAKSIISVRLEGHEGIGNFEEINHKNQKITGNVKLNFAHDWKSLTGYSFNDSEQISTYSGHRIDM